MSKAICFSYPTPTVPVRACGRIILIKVGGKSHRFVIHDGKLSDYRSGMLVCNLNPIKIRRMARISHHTRTTDRQAAEIALAEIIDRVGLETFQAKLAAAPKLNGSKP